MNGSGWSGSGVRVCVCVGGGGVGEGVGGRGGGELDWMAVCDVRCVQVMTERTLVTV